MNWQLAHRIAGIAAVQAQHALSVDRTDYVDVFTALREAGVDGLARPMPRLFGVYFSPMHNGPSVLLNAGLDIIMQRHTAAHELGHHRLGHGTSADKELDPALRWGRGSWRDEEKIAEAFASWFLMPRPAVLGALTRLGVDRPRNPHEVYQIARWLGTSYAGTARHLQRLRLANQDTVDAWLKVSPGQIRYSLLGCNPPGHVHLLDVRAHETTVRADVGDVLLLELPEARLAALPAGLATFTADKDMDAGHPSLAFPEPEKTAVCITGDLIGTQVLTAEIPSANEPFRVAVARQSPRVGDQSLWPR